MIPKDLLSDISNSISLLASLWHWSESFNDLYVITHTCLLKVHLHVTIFVTLTFSTILGVYPLQFVVYVLQIVSYKFYHVNGPLRRRLVYLHPPSSPSDYHQRDVISTIPRCLIINKFFFIFDLFYKTIFFVVFINGVILSLFYCWQK